MKRTPEEIAKITESMQKQMENDKVLDQIGNGRIALMMLVAAIRRIQFRQTLHNLAPVKAKLTKKKDVGVYLAELPSTAWHAANQYRLLPTLMQVALILCAATAQFGVVLLSAILSVIYMCFGRRLRSFEFQAEMQEATAQYGDELTAEQLVACVLAHVEKESKKNG